MMAALSSSAPHRGPVSALRRAPAIVMLALIVGALASCSSNTTNAEPTSDPVDLVVSDAWIRPGIDPTAVYLNVVNLGSHPVAITGAEADWAESITIHNTVEENGLLVMKRLDSVAVDPGAAVLFTPNGLHVMVEGLAAPIDYGDLLELVLLTDDGQKIAIRAEAR